MANLVGLFLFANATKSNGAYGGQGSKRYCKFCSTCDSFLYVHQGKLVKTFRPKKVQDVQKYCSTTEASETKTKWSKERLKSTVLSKIYQPFAHTFCKACNGRSNFGCVFKTV